MNMPVWMIKLNVPWKTALCIAALVLFTALCIVSAIAVKDAREKNEYHASVKDENEAVDYLCAIGEDGAVQLRCDSIRIPAEFDNVYQEYNVLQQKSGRDLDGFRGKDVLKYTYALSGKNTAYAVLLIKNGDIIGGHLTNGEYGGEYLPLP